VVRQDGLRQLLQPIRSPRSSARDRSLREREVARGTGRRRSRRRAPVMSVPSRSGRLRSLPPRSLPFSTSLPFVPLPFLSLRLDSTPSRRLVEHSRKRRGIFLEFPRIGMALFLVRLVDPLVFFPSRYKEIGCAARVESAEQADADKLVEPAANLARRRVVIGKDLRLKLLRLVGMDAVIIGKIPYPYEEEPSVRRTFADLLARPELRLNRPNSRHRSPRRRH